MNEHEKIISSALLLLLFLAWFAFLVHEDPRFAGSAAGGLFGVVGASLILVPYLYLVVKRVPALRRWWSRRMTLSTFLEIHIYAGILGPIFGLVHTGHKFQSPVGILLTTLMLVVVFSGFVGRYLLGIVSADIRDKKEMLAALEQEYHRLSLEVTASSAGQDTKQLLASRGIGRLARILGGLTPGRDGLFSRLARVVGVSEAIADVEYALDTDRAIRVLFSRWLKLHIVLSFALLAVLALHIVTSFYFGVRWLQG
jgi:hypothetical protein